MKVQLVKNEATGLYTRESLTLPEQYEDMEALLADSANLPWQLIVWSITADKMHAIICPVIECEPCHPEHPVFSGKFNISSDGFATWDFTAQDGYKYLGSFVGHAGELYANFLNLARMAQLEGDNLIAYWEAVKNACGLDYSRENLSKTADVAINGVRNNSYANDLAATGWFQNIGEDANEPVN